MRLSQLQSAVVLSSLCEGERERKPRLCVRRLFWSLAFATLLPAPLPCRLGAAVANAESREDSSACAAAAG